VNSNPYKWCHAHETTCDECHDSGLATAHSMVRSYAPHPTLVRCLPWYTSDQGTSATLPRASGLRLGQLWHHVVGGNGKITRCDDTGVGCGKGGKSRQGLSGHEPHKKSTRLCALVKRKKSRKIRTAGTRETTQKGDAGAFLSYVSSGLSRDETLGAMGHTRGVASVCGASRRCVETHHGDHGVRGKITSWSGQGCRL